MEGQCCEGWSVTAVVTVTQGLAGPPGPSGPVLMLSKEELWVRDAVLVWGLPPLALCCLVGGGERGLSLPITFQHLIYPADRLNRTTVLALLDDLSRELRTLVEHPDGTKDKPAATCKELLLAHPNLPDGTGLPCAPSQGTRQGGWISFINAFKRE